MNEYAMYLRKSRSDVEMENLSKEDTLKRHRVILEDLAKRLQIKVTDVFTEVVSGENIADRFSAVRPGFQPKDEHRMKGIKM